MNRKLMLTGVTLGAIAAMGACSNDSQKPEDPSVGQLDIALSIEGDYTVSSVEITIESEDPGTAVSRHRTIDVSDPNASVSATEGGLPEGGYSVLLEANLEDDPETPDVDESDVDCEGSLNGVQVAAGETAQANLVLTCTIDGGKVQVAGGISIHAETEVETINTCPDLIGSAFVGPLDTSTGASVQLVAQAAEGVGDVAIAWSASAGSIAEDGSSYTCPAIAGTYTIEAEFVRDSGCDQLFSEQVSCHNGYEGPVAALPTSFALDGCNLGSPCHLEQDGKAWQLVCGNVVTQLRTITGEADGENSFPFVAPNGSECLGSVVGGEFVGTCTDFSGETCDFVSDSTPDPTPVCPVIAELTNVTTCSGTHGSCDVVQDGCNILAKCGDTYFGRDVNSAGDVRLQERHDGMDFYCQAPTVDGAAAGQCVQSGRGIQNPVSCDYSAGIVEAVSACTEGLPTDGFVLEGCGFDDICFAQEQGCAWQVSCSGGTYGAIATETGAYEFQGPNGESCAGEVVDGKFVGSCGSGETACTFGTVEPEVDASCFQLPRDIAARGCRFSQPEPFTIVQDGCKFMGINAAGEFVVGDVTETGITFPGINPSYGCHADLNETGDELWGDCEIPREDGSIGSCRDLTSSQGAPLVISFL